MQDDTQKEFISHLSSFLPERKRGKRGTKPIEKELLVSELFKLFRTNCGWRNIQHSSTCRNYLKEIQRRGLFKEFFTFSTKDLVKNRVKKSIVDSSDIVSYQTNGLVRYSGKYHNPCIKFTIGVNEDLVPIEGYIDHGSKPDSVIYAEMLLKRKMLPLEEFLDMGYEKYARRRELKIKGCQIRMEMKNTKKNRKRGPRFVFTNEQKLIRGSIEKVVGWIKAFMITRLCRLRIKSLISAMFYFCLSYVTFMRLEKL